MISFMYLIPLPEKKSMIALPMLIKVCAQVRCYVFWQLEMSCDLHEFFFSGVINLIDSEHTWLSFL